jgi:murein DD-endopeptidase MepM/ murein hydrolase activator NlpD
MLFKWLWQDNSRPTVKKVSELINTKSHKQKKYISLMLVPSYSTGRTRSLRIPRNILYIVIITMFMISAVVTGFYLRSNYFMQMAQDLSDSLDETQEAFIEFQQTSEQVQSNLIDATTQMYEQLSEEQQRARSALDRQAREHQDALEYLQDQVDEFERMIREFDDQVQEMIDNLGSRSIIPPVANLLRQLESAQEEIRALSILYNEPDEEGDGYVYAHVSAGFLSVGYNPRPQITEEELLTRLYVLINELEIQRQLFEIFEEYRERMEPYIRNYPTIWPISGQISSGFGWRQNPMGGRGTQHHDGIDIRAPRGTPIRATGGGTVVSAGWQNGYGNTVVISHGSGITTMYAHNTRNNVRVGQRVERGEIIAYVGSTGLSTGNHLHYEVRVNGRAVNPVPYLMERHS